MGYPIFHSQYTAAQIEASIGKTPRIKSSTRTWEIWDIATSAYVDTGVSIDTQLYVDPTLTESGYAADAKVTGDKLGELKSAITTIGLVSKNLFDKNSVVVGYRVLPGSGKTYNDLEANTDRCASNIIPISPSTKYAFNSALLDGNSATVYQYTSIGAYIGQTAATAQTDGSYYFESFNNAYYIRFSYDSAVLDNNKFMFVQGQTIPLKYVAYNAGGVVGGELFDTEKALIQLTAEVESLPQITTEINLGTLINGYVNSTNGYFNDASSYKRTAHIPVVSRSIKVVDTFNAANVGFAFYDQNKKYISGFDGTGHSRGDVISVTIPYNAKYFVYCAPNALADSMRVFVSDVGNALNQGTINPVQYDGNEVVVFNKILCIGDSMTEGTFNHMVGGVNTAYVDVRYAYPTLLKAMTGRDITNKGDGGQSTKSWYERHSTDDLSGHDACIIELGINDAHGAAAVQTTSEERRTALGNIISKVKTDNPQIKIFLSTLFNTYKTPADIAVNEDIRYVAENTADCYLVDLETYGDIWKGNNLDRSDTANHLTAIGYRKLAKEYFAYISWIIANNANDFKYVQFAGTDYVYD